MQDERIPVITRVGEERVRARNNARVRPGDYVLYWMQSSHRTEENPAFVYAIEQADRAGLPLVVYFGGTCREVEERDSGSRYLRTRTAQKRPPECDSEGRVFGWRRIHEKTGIKRIARETTLLCSLFLTLL